MKIGIAQETRTGETRLAIAPDTIKKLVKTGFEILIQSKAGEKAGYSDKDFEEAGGKIVSADQAWSSDLVFRIHRPENDQIKMMKKGSLLFCMAEPYKQDDFMSLLVGAGIDLMAMELLPRTSRAQSMDVLSSQANIAGYRAVVEGAAQYKRFFPMMMTSAGSAKAAKVAVLGAGVAGLQAIATARRLGGSVEAYDVRPEVKEQILSCGAKFMELDVGEQGSGSGGYAKELSEEGKRKQQAALTERLKKFDVIISTANIPGRKAPVLITEDAVKGMRTGSVIVDLAAANGGNCPLTEADKIVIKHGVTLVGLTNYPALVPADASAFYARNLANLLAIMAEKKDGKLSLNVNLEDDIITATLAVYQGQVRFKGR